MTFILYDYINNDNKNIHFAELCNLKCAFTFIQFFICSSQSFYGRQKDLFLMIPFDEITYKYFYF